MTRIVVVYIASDGNPQKTFYDDATAWVATDGVLEIKPIGGGGIAMLALFAPGVWRRAESLEMPEGKQP